MKIRQFVKLILSKSLFNDFKIGRFKTGAALEYIGFRSLSNNAVDDDKNVLRKKSF